VLCLAVLGGVLLAGCQREGPIFDDTGTNPTTGVPVTPVAPIPVAPRPSPTPTPNPPEDPPRGDPGNPDGPGDNIPDNTEPVARVEARVFFIECGGQVVPGYAEVDVGCRVHLDVTPKDSGGRHTRAKGGPVWAFSNPGIISVNSVNDYTPTFTALAPGDLSILCTVDGITSPPITIRLK